MKVAPGVPMKVPVTVGREGMPESRGCSAFRALQPWIAVAVAVAGRMTTNLVKLRSRVSSVANCSAVTTP